MKKRALIRPKTQTPLETGVVRKIDGLLLKVDRAIQILWQLENRIARLPQADMNDVFNSLNIVVGRLNQRDSQVIAEALKRGDICRRKPRRVKKTKARPRKRRGS